MEQIKYYLDWALSEYKIYVKSAKLFDIYGIQLRCLIRSSWTTKNGKSRCSCKSSTASDYNTAGYFRHFGLGGGVKISTALLLLTVSCCPKNIYYRHSLGNHLPDIKILS